MALKFFLFALLVIYSAQGLEAKSVRNSEERGIIEEIQKIIQAAVELVKTTIDQIKAVLKNLYDSLQEQAQEEIRKALEALKNLHEKAHEALQKLIEQAGDLAKEVQACVDAKQGEILEAYNAAQEGSLKCVDASKSVIVGAVGGVKTVVEDSVNTLQGLLKEFKACEKVLCQVQVVAKAIDSVPKIKDAVVASVSAAREVVANEVPKFAACSNEVAVTYQKAMEAINKDIMQCVDNIKQ